MRILVNADDFGYNTNVNAGIIDAFRNGIVRSTSLMVGGATCLEAALMAKEYTGLEVGLHFNITDGFCCAEPNKIPLLADDNGLFYFDSNDIRLSISKIRELASSNQQFIGQIEQEFWAQVKKFDQLQMRPKHIDMHHYIHLMHHFLFAQFCDFANQLGIPFRGPCQPVLQNLHLPSSSLVEMEALVRNTSVPSPEISISNLVSRNASVIPGLIEYENMIIAQLEGLELSGVSSVELITHPAQFNTVIADQDDYAWARKLESALVSSSTFLRYIKQHNYEIILHADLR